MRRITLTDAQVSALVQELRALDLSSKPASQDLLRRLERLLDRNDIAARYPTPPADSEDSQADHSEKSTNSRKVSGRSAAWRCEPQDPSSQSHEVPIPMQSVFALDTAGAAARATIKQFESRHPQGGMDVSTEQGGDHPSRDSDISDIQIKEESEEDVIVETSGLRKRKRRRTRME